MATTEIAVAQPQQGGLVQFNNEQINLIARTICKPKNRNPTKDELSLFLGQCKRTGLDPFAKQIYAIFRYDKRAGGEVMGIQVAIDGFRLVAERTGCYLGKASTEWCGPDEEWHEVWAKAVPPLAAKVTVRKIVQGHVAEVPAVAHWKEYASDQGLWKNMPANQLAKCAEALALRQAFPNDLSGLYTADEMAQAVAPASPAQQAAALPTTNAGMQQKAMLGEGGVVMEEAPKIDPQTVKALQAAIDEAGVDKKWLQKQLVAIGVEDVNHPHALTTLSEGEARALLSELSMVIDAKVADAEADVVEGDVFHHEDGSTR